MNALNRNLKNNLCVTQIASALTATMAFGLLTVSFSGTALAQTKKHENITLEQIQSIGNVVQAPEKLTVEKDLRSRALLEAAQSYGARAGLAQETNKIREVLEDHASTWDVAFNFGALMLVDEQIGEANPTLRPRLIIPPVILHTVQNTRQDSGDVFHIVDETFTIKEQAKFSSVAPTWRSYLIRDANSMSVTPPHSSLLPKTDEERVKFKEGVADGWRSGIAQAKAIYKSDLARLTRDYEGMSLYLELVEQKKVSVPFVATSNQAITGDENTMNINDVTLKITVMPSFQKDSNKWTPLTH